MLRRHGWVRVFVRDFEGNPRTQYRTHKVMARFWVANWAAATVVYLLLPGTWARVSILYLVWISLYANWSTDAGAMAASEAAGEDAVSAYAIGREAEREHDSPEESAP